MLSRLAQPIGARGSGHALAAGLRRGVPVALALGICTGGTLLCAAEPPAPASAAAADKPARPQRRSKGSFEARVRGKGRREEVVDHVLDVAELKRVAGASNDVLKAVQNLPGVARPPFGAGQIVVWGAAPGDTRVYADGVLIPRLYHFGGLRSTLNSEFIEQVSFRPGAYGADFGRGLGGVINITTRAPRADRLHGSVTLDLIDGSFTLEGPLTPKLHFAAAGRISWIAALLPLFNSGPTKLLPFYWDYQLALRYRPSDRDDLDLLIFGSNSDVEAKVDAPNPTERVDLRSRSYFSRARLRWTRRLSADTSFTLTPSIGEDTFSLDTGDVGFNGQPLVLRQSQLGYNLRAELRHRPHPLYDTATGVDIEGTHAAVDVLAPVGKPGDNSSEGQGTPAGGLDLIRDAANAEGAFIGNSLFAPSQLVARERAVFDLFQAAPYFIARIRLFDDRLLVSPQLRASIDYFRSYDGSVSRLLMNLEPRLFIQLQVVPGRLSLKAALGVYHQPPHGGELSRQFGNPLLGLQAATTYVLGADVEVTPTLHVEAQGFYKDLRDLVVPDPTLQYTNDAIGRVYGGELLVRQALWRGLSGWVAYTLSRSERKDAPDQAWHLFRFDQTHILTLILSYKLPRGFDVGVRFRYVTGNPTTPVVGGVRDTLGQRYVPVQGDPYSARLPDFHQLDLRIDKTFTFKKWKLGLYLDLQNLYNQTNTENLVYGGRQLQQVARIPGIPLFPNLGLRADF